MGKAIGTAIGVLLMIGTGYLFSVVAGGSFNPFEWNWFIRLLAAAWLAGWLVYTVGYCIEDTERE